MKLKTKIFMGILGGAVAVATPAVLLASCSTTDPVKVPFSAPTAITKNGLSGFEGNSKNPATALSDSNISVNALSVTLTASAAANTYMGLTLPTTLGKTLTGAVGFAETATVTWALIDSADKNFELDAGSKVVNKVAMVQSSIKTTLVGTVKGDVNIDGKVESKEAKFELTITFAPFGQKPTPETPTTIPTTMTKTGLLAKEGTALNSLAENSTILNSATITNLSITLTSSAAANTYMGLTLPTTLGDTFTGFTGFTKSANIAWTLKTGSETNFDLNTATRELTNKNALNTTGVTATLVGTITESGMQQQTFEITVKFVLHS